MHVTLHTAYCFASLILHLWISASGLPLCHLFLNLLLHFLICVIRSTGDTELLLPAIVVADTRSEFPYLCAAENYITATTGLMGLSHHFLISELTKCEKP